VLTDLRGFDRTGLIYERVRTAMGNGLASAAHQDHRRQRLIMQPAFRREHLRGHVAVMRQEITAAMASWHDGDRVDLVDEMFTLTTTIALRALFSSHLNPARPNACAAPSTSSSAASTPGPWRPGAPRSATSSRATARQESATAT
jgi:cytochrome P450